MSLIALVIILALVGFVCYLVVTYIPMPAPFKQAIVVIVVLVLILWPLSALGLVGPTVPRLR